jgi:hypothetical protein
MQFAVLQKGDAGEFARRWHITPKQVLEQRRERKLTLADYREIDARL